TESWRPYDPAATVVSSRFIVVLPPRAISPPPDKPVPALTVSESLASLLLVTALSKIFKVVIASLSMVQTVPLPDTVISVLSPSVTPPPPQLPVLRQISPDASG